MLIRKDIQIDRLDIFYTCEKDVTKLPFNRKLKLLPRSIDCSNSIYPESIRHEIGKSMYSGYTAQGVICAIISARGR